MSHIDWMRDWYELGWGAGDEDVRRRHAADDIEDVWHGTTDVERLVAVVQGSAPNLSRSRARGNGPSGYCWAADNDMDDARHRPWRVVRPRSNREAGRDPCDLPG